MTTHIAQNKMSKEIFRLRNENEMWLVQALSETTQDFITVGEWSKKSDALDDLNEWVKQ